MEEPPLASPPFIPSIKVRDLNVLDDQAYALMDVKYDLKRSEILAFLQQLGCGKTISLKGLNRMLNGIKDVRVKGSIRMEGQNVYGPDFGPPEHRQQFGACRKDRTRFPEDATKT